MLVDAQAVLFALIKGRSSAPTLRFEVRRIAAHALAADVLLHFLWVPSEHNPADAPSRGLRWRSSHRRPPRTTRPTRLERYLNTLARSWDRLKSAGMVSSIDSSSSLDRLSSCSSTSNPWALGSCW